MQSDKSDIDIIKGMREGKVSAFRDLYTRYSNLIYRNILVRVNSSFDADDIFQDFYSGMGEKRVAGNNFVRKKLSTSLVEKPYLKFDQERTDSGSLSRDVRGR